MFRDMSAGTRPVKEDKPIKYGASSSNKWYKLRCALAFFLAAMGYSGLVFREAKRAARVAGKPLLNVGCKRVYTDASDVNLDIVQREVPHFIRGDIQNLEMFDYREFGAAFASHVLEHVDDPDIAMSELHRVAENVFIITPLPVWPWAWLYPGHKWVFWGTRKICRLPRSRRNGAGGK